tara:strand:- start:1460 stop:1825 length:366 start_codon:yes stop_codon:yes gene_type:complete
MMGIWDDVQEGAEDIWEGAGDVIPGADDIGDVIGSFVVAIVNAVIPVIENLIPALVESVRRGFMAIREGIRGSEADVITTFTIIIFMLGAFITARGILSRGRMAGLAPAAPSIPVVGAVPL